MLLVMQWLYGSIIVLKGNVLLEEGRGQAICEPGCVSTGNCMY